MKTESPSDVLRQKPSELRRRVGGRVTATGEHFAIGDVALSLRVAFADEVDLELGDLVVVDGRRGETGLEDARIVEIYRHNKHVETGDFARLTRRSFATHLRAGVVHRVRTFFLHEGFLEVDTPCIVPSPGLDLHLDAFDVPGAGYLSTSPELQMKRLLVGGVPRCFQIAHCFRKGEQGSRHNPEFTMLEWYRAFAGVDEVMDDTERLVQTLARDYVLPRIKVGKRSVDLSLPFARMSVGDAFARWACVSADEAIDLATTDEERFFRLLVDRVEPAIADLGCGVFLTDYPAPFASLARLSPRDPRVAERFELYVGDLELSNGFGELTDPVEQRARFERDREARARLGKPVYPIDERFIAALEEGMPPSAGNALGLDRLVALVFETAKIGEVMTFPTDWL